MTSALYFFFKKFWGRKCVFLVELEEEHSRQVGGRHHEDALWVLTTVVVKELYLQRQKQEGPRPRQGHTAPSQASLKSRRLVHSIRVCHESNNACPQCTKKEIKLLCFYYAELDVVNILVYFLPVHVKLFF